ncbi:NAD-dependent protein deacylase [Thermotoga sp. KOL6]|uniref:NAD-dependent protein deacylase n=1 Tax=Thermotoga sp. KOL6 TaxID=126741 RepID=UPI000C780402|nr:NAD-dependent protein deacylase [Thermotoga sp. KOL6]PLV59214.1 NAD-dependent deacetylase [Thermotoga sp. KOL6]
MKEFIKLLNESSLTVVLTGAGISTPSGIPDFRGPNGIYKKYPQNIFDIDFFYTHPQDFYRFAKEAIFPMLNTKPNLAHLLLAKLEEKGLIEAVITQNIDRLHQKAGNKKVIELHGNVEDYYCVKCGKEYTVEIVKRKLEVAEVPECDECLGLIRPNIVFFGEPLPQNALQEATKLSSEANLMIVIGSSLVVYPAAELPLLTVRSGGKLVIVNMGSTTLDDLATLKYNMDVVEFAKRVMEEGGLR